MQESLPRPEPRLRPVVYILGALLVVLVLAAVWYSPALLWSLLPFPEVSMKADEAPPPASLDLPDEFKPKAAQYGGKVVEVKPPPPMPVAQPVPPPPLPVVLTPAPVAPPAPAPVVQAQIDPLPKLLEQMQRRDEIIDQKLAQQRVLPPQMPVPPPEAAKPKEKPGTKAWGIKPTDGNLKERKAKEGRADEQTAGGKAGDAFDLITHAKWARPADVRKTLYMSQRLPGRLADPINSDEPGIT